MPWEKWLMEKEGFIPACLACSSMIAGVRLRVVVAVTVLETHDTDQE
jgi:hypothetical protein